MSCYRHIVCGVDFSAHADQAFAVAAEQARRDQARLSLVYVLVPGLPLLPGGDPREPRRLSDQEIRQRLEAAIVERYLCRAPDLHPELELRRGHPSIEILNFLKASGADLMVMGSHGLSGVGLVLLGSVAERVSRRAPCSCLMVRLPQPA
ncbi:MAG: universal stress protein [Thermodesulfobacteriota bacterium]